ncbi:MAG: DNA polymerase I [Acidimicrobiales bacterium]
MATYLLLDGHSLAYRAWFALQDADLTTASGQRTAAVYGFTQMLGRLLEDHSPAGMAVVFDRPEPTFRHGIADDYKAGRAETPEPLREQLGLIRQVVETLGVPAVDYAGYEADDVLATLASRLEAAGEQVIIVTGDRDAYQLVSDPGIRVLYNRRGVTDYVLYDEAGIEGRTGVRPDRYPLLAALRGDPSDNLPGVPGVGEKTAARLVNTYEDIDALFAHLDELTPKLRLSLAECEARVRQNFVLTPLVRDVPVEVELEQMRFGRSDREALDRLFKLLELRVPRDKITKELDRLEGVPGGVPSMPATAPAVPEVDIVDLAEPDMAAAWLSALLAGGGSLVLEPEWAGPPGRSVITGLALAALPVAGASPPGVLAVGWLAGPLLFDDTVRAALETILCAQDAGGGRVVTYRAKELMRALSPLGLRLDGLDLDVAVAGYLADPATGQSSLELLAGSASALVSGRGVAARSTKPVEAVEQLGFDLDGGAGAEALLGAESTDDLSDAMPTARRVALLASLAPTLRTALHDAGAERLYSEVERPLIGVLAKMELVGVAVDVPWLEGINSELTDQVAALEADLWRLAGEEFNVNSTHQLRRILFDKLGLAPQKRTKTGYSTDAQTLERMRGDHEIVDTLLAYREVEKLRSTYGTGLLSEVAPDGRIHASFNQTVARTGRLSSDQPNLHNIPVRSTLGRRFRQAFVPAPGCELLVADYDQIELRVIAHLAEDPGLVEAFRTGLDIHNATASRVFSVDPADVTPAMRSKAKMISYGLAYGMEAYGLSQRLAVPVEEAAAILAQYFSAFPNVKEYMSKTVAEARMHGYTETLFGRRRYLPELDSPNFRVRQAAERQAMNAGIQGLAADIFKVALVRLDAELVERGLRSRIVLQVHDEVLVESLAEEADDVESLTRIVMESACELAVPLAVHVARGRTWAEAKESGGSTDTGEDDDPLGLDGELDSVI